MYNKEELAEIYEECPLLLTQRVMAGKWKLSIIWFLAENEVMRFGELKKAFDDPVLTQKMLTQHLKELEEDGLVSRKAYDEMPKKVEYNLTEIGKSFVPIMQSMETWGESYRKIWQRRNLHRIQK